MAVYLYSKSCPSCGENHALEKVKQVCKQQNVDFQERRTILWERYEEEANKIMGLNPGLKLPFFYNETNGKTLHGDNFTSIEEIKKLIKD